MKLGLLAAGLVLVAGGAAGCGGGGSSDSAAPKAPTTTAFCAALKEFQDQFADPDPTKDVKTYIKALKASAQKLDDLGTPDGMPSDAQAGFDLQVQGITGLSDDATLDDVADLGTASSADTKRLQALDDYVTKTCPELSGTTTQ